MNNLRLFTAVSRQPGMIAREWILWTERRSVFFARRYEYQNSEDRFLVGVDMETLYVERTKESVAIQADQKTSVSLKMPCCVVGHVHGKVF